MRKSHTQISTILKYLQQTSEWIPAYKLQQTELLGTWIGSSGARRCRELTEEGKLERKVQGRYVYYRAVQPKEYIEYRDSLTGEVIHRKAVYEQ